MTRRVESLEEAIEIAKSGGDVMCKCPAHEDDAASLHVKKGDKQPVIMTCHADCKLDEILSAGNIDPQSIMEDTKEFVPTTTTGADQNAMWTPVGIASTKYQYKDENGRLLFEVFRVPQGTKKRFIQRRPDIENPRGYSWNMDGVRRVLYRLQEILAAKGDGKTIYVVEGEKDVETLEGLGEVATTSPMGAGKWDESYSETLAGANIIIIADKDEPGRRHARAVRESLIEHGCTVTLKEAKTGCKDVTDHIVAGGTLESLIETVPGDAGQKSNTGVDVLDIVKRVVQQSSFVIPGVLAAGDRWLLTAFEGHGKSTLVRQLCVQVACGIHPWLMTDMPRQKVLLIDAENHPDQVLESWQKMVNLAAYYGHALEPEQLIVLETWDMDLDLTSEEGTQWLVEQVTGHQPKLVGIGPLYNLSSRDLSEHQVATRLKQAINLARGISGAAFIMEHHAPHGQGGGDRSVRPYGSSVFLKWPDFGHGLKPIEQEGVYELQKTRFNRVRGREFPTHMRWGNAQINEWDWMGAYMDEHGNLY